MSDVERPILPEFETVATTDGKAAQAMSELAVRPAGTFAVSCVDTTFPFHQSDLVAMGTTFIDADPDYTPDEQASLLDYANPDEVKLRDAYFLAADLVSPYSTFRAFVDGYKGFARTQRVIGKVIHHMQEDAELPVDGLDPLGELTNAAITGSMSQGLRTLVSYAVFNTGKNGEGRHGCALIVPEATLQVSAQIVNDLGEAAETEEGRREIDYIKAVAERISPDTDFEANLMRVLNTSDGPGLVAANLGALCLAPVDTAEGTLSADERLAPYMGKSRKEIKAMLKQEEKQRRRG